MIMRLDFVSDGQTVTDIDDARIFAGSLQNSRSFGRKTPQMDARTLIAAVLAPHYAEDTELREIRFSLQDIYNFFVFAFLQAVLDKDFISDHKYPWISAAERRQSLATAGGRGSFVTTRTSRGSGERFFRRYRG